MMKSMPNASGNKRAKRALERSPETEDFPFFIALCTTGETREV